MSKQVKILIVHNLRALMRKCTYRRSDIFVEFINKKQKTIHFTLFMPWCLYIVPTISIMASDNQNEKNNAWLNRSKQYKHKIMSE